MASLLHTSKPQFTLNFLDVHKQDGYNDCRVFAVAFATALCMGCQPGKFFKTEEIALAFVKEFGNGEKEMFPILKRRERMG